jgi:hypothetical protein
MKAMQWKKMLLYVCGMLLVNLAFATNADAYEEQYEDAQEISAGGGEIAHLYQLAVQDELREVVTQDERLSYFHP